MKKTLIVLIVLLTGVFSSCSDDEKVEDYYLRLETPEASTVNLTKEASVREIDIATNIDALLVTVANTGADWCTASYSSGKLIISVNINAGFSERSTSVLLEGQGANLQIEVSQTAQSFSGGDIADDIKVAISSATASGYQPGEGIERSYDGDMSTLYHSKYGAASLPVDLVYNFSDVDGIDYFIYYPRTDGGTNGRFKDIEVWVSTEAVPDFQKLGDYDLQESSAASKIAFASTIAKPKSIKIVVKSGTGNFASCAEMEFYKKATSTFDYLTIFTDEACWELKPNVAQADIDNIPLELYKALAQSIFSNTYEAEFRVQSYNVYRNPDLIAAENKTSQYSIRDNPTGIYVDSGDELIFFADNTVGKNVSLVIQDLGVGFGSATSYPVSDGPNKYTTKNAGLIYVSYLNSTGTGSPVKINILGGKVNGYFNSEKHTEADWAKLLGNAGYKDFDVLGKYAHLTFPTTSFKTYAATNGLALINRFDELVYLEQEFMGLKKYNKMIKNRAYFMVDYVSTGWMYATSYRTGYVPGAMTTVASLSGLNADPWGPAHELGHVNQTRPGLRWFGMTEVTNNIHSQYIQITFNGISRLQKEGHYDVAFSKYVGKNVAHHLLSDSNEAGIYNGVFYKLIPFWQLKLYMHDVLGKDDFYKDVYEYYRTHLDPSTTGLTDGVLQLNFVRVACQVANLDLTDFFQAWGFLTAVDAKGIMDANTQFTITQAQIDALKAEIAAKNYPKPAHNNIQMITDANVASYK